MINKFATLLQQHLPLEQIISDEMLRYAYATDASMYRMLPQLVVIIYNEKEVVVVLQHAAALGMKLTFRAAGTSLSGQAVSDQVLVVLAPAAWQAYAISPDGGQITLEPGIIGAQANHYLAPFKRKIGPDPGSLAAAKIGGIVANNASGMCCGISNNTYATLISLRVILADGTILDSADLRSYQRLLQSHRALLAGLQDIHKEINGDKALVSFIQSKFAIKNTSGYSLNAFLDYSDPLKILEHLLIGSEGTLGFVSQVTLATIVDEEFKALNIVFADLAGLIKLTQNLANCAVSAIELLDACALNSVSNLKELQPYLPALNHDSAAIIIEISAGSAEQLQEKILILSAIIGQGKIIQQSGFSCDTAVQQIIWQARKGILPTIAGMRPLGSSVVIEDVAVGAKYLLPLIIDLQTLFIKYQYTNAAIFGHVLAGNIHFVLTPNFQITEQLHTYAAFMQEFTSLVVSRYNGSLKAEHGSGRNIAPFAKLEWGERCWEIMWRIKQLFDPQNMLNPEVKLTRQNNVHLQNLKEMAPVSSLIDACMECGFCEVVCPSRKFSLSPRQRIAVARGMQQLKGKRLGAWKKSYAYYGIDTCATTGMCQTRCPVGIDTGEFILSLKPVSQSTTAHNKKISQARLQLQLANLVARVIGKPSLVGITKVLHNKFRKIPLFPGNPNQN